MTPIQVVEAVFEAFSRGDIAQIAGMVAEGASWHQAESVPWGGRYTGPQGVLEFFRKLDSVAETTQFEVRENIPAGNEVFSFGVYGMKSRQTGKSASAEWMFRWKVEDGKIVFYDSYEDTAALSAALEVGRLAAV